MTRRRRGGTRKGRPDHKKKAATIYDVAAASGVSIATVSRFTRGIGRMPEEQRQRIATAIRELGYRPSGLAISLASRLKQSIGLIILKGHRAYTRLVLSEILGGVAGAALERGWSVNVTLLDHADPEARALDRHIDLVDGSLVLDYAWNEPRVRQLDAAGHRIVVLNRFDCPRPHVSVDNAGGAKLAAEHLLEIGHRRIAVLGGGIGVGRVRMDACVARLRAAGVTPLAALDCRFSQAEAAAAARELLAARLRPTALFVASDWMAVGVLHAAQEMGFRVPDDLSIVGFDDVIIAQTTRPALTTVRQPLDELGRSGFHLFCELLRDPAHPPPPQLLTTTLILRGSTALCPANTVRRAAAKRKA